MNNLWTLAKSNAPLALSLAALGLLTIAWIFQYGFGYAPCDLCYTQRQPYYAIIPLGLLGWMMDHKHPQIGRYVLLAIIALLFLNAGVGIYHAGAEYGWWQGPNTCTTSLLAGGTIEDMLAAIEAAPLVRCDVAAWTLFGISMAGYNAIAASVLGLFGLRVLRDRKNA